MSLTEHKLTQENIRQYGVVAAPDRLTGTAQENKKLFDRLIREVFAGDFNALIDELAELGVEQAVLLPEGAGFKYVRLNANSELEVSEDGTAWQATGQAPEAAARAKASAESAAAAQTAAETAQAGAQAAQTGAQNANAAAAASASAAAGSASAASASASQAAAYAAQIGTPVAGIVEDWLSEHIDPESTTVVIDRSLSVEDAAADAKAAGAADSAVKALHTQRFSGGVTLSVGGLNADGADYTTQKRVRTALIPLRTAATVRLADTTYSIRAVFTYEGQTKSREIVFSSSGITDEILIGRKGAEDGFRAAFAMTADADHTMTDEDLAAIAEKLIVGYPTDEALTAADVPADAAEAGRLVRGAYRTADVSGNPAAFADGAEGLPVKTLTVAFSPARDGSGTPSAENPLPFRAFSSIVLRHSGENLLLPDKFFVNAEHAGTASMTIADGVVQVTTTTEEAWLENSIGYLPPGRYTLRRFGTVGILAMTLYKRVNGENVWIATISASNPIYTFTSDGATNYRLSSAAIPAGVTRRAGLVLTAGSAAPENYLPLRGQEHRITVPTCYAGKLDATGGTLRANKHYAAITSEQAQALVGPWVSSMDEYAGDTTPTVGAEVIDLGAWEEPQTVSVPAIRTMQGGNGFCGFAGSAETAVSLTYRRDPDLAAQGTSEVDLTDADIYVSADDTEMFETAAEAYAAYDALVEAYPHYVSRRVWHDDSGTFSNYEYVFTRGAWNESSVPYKFTTDGEVAKPKVLLSTSVHGREAATVPGLYRIMKDMCEGRGLLKELAESVEWHVMPVVCPDGFTGRTRTNAGGVNINRNCDSGDWTYHGAGTENYGGAAPADQSETQAFQRWIDANTDAALYIDWHNMSNVTEGGMTTYQITTFMSKADPRERLDDIIDLKKKYLFSIARVIPYWISRRGLPEDECAFAFSGGFLYNASIVGGTCAQYGRHKGIISFTLETGPDLPEHGKESAFSIGVGIEGMANTLLGLTDFFRREMDYPQPPA